MAKVTAPFLSLTASGTLGKTLTASKWKGIAYMRNRVIPKNPKSVDQMYVRDIISDASIAWKDEATVGGVVIDAGYKAAFATLAEGTAMSGFNLYMKECIALNYVGTPRVYDGTLAVPAEPTV